MPDKADLTRRRVLQTVGAGIGAAGMAGVAAGSGNGNYIIGLESSASLSIATAPAVEVEREMDLGDVGKVVTGRYTEEELTALRRNSKVRYVAPNRFQQLVDPLEPEAETTLQDTPWGIERVRATDAIENGATGEDATIAVVDTGIDSTHEDLAENIVDGYAAIECGGGILSTEEQECVEPWDDDNNHGTHVAGSAAAADNGVGVVGVAPEADLLAVKAISGSGAGLPGAIVDGVKWAADNGADVINMSLGGPVPLPGLGDAIDYANDNGALVVAAAGNSGGEDEEPCEDCVGYPAAFDNTVAVSATNEDDDIGFFSSTGPEVDLAAPGVEVKSSVAAGDSAYDTYSGTSMASPHVAGAVATLVGEGVDPMDAPSLLESAADDVGLPPEYQGSGRLDVADAVDEVPEPGPVAVSTGEATDIDEESATLNGTLDSLEGYSEADVLFEYGPAGSGFPESAAAGTVGAGEEFSVEVEGLEAGTSYEFVAVAIAGGGEETAEGIPTSFETDDPFAIPCFITTATANDVETLDSLRRFRDESMGATPVGRGMVGLYYRISPPIANTLERHPDSTETGLTRRLVETCASLSDRQDASESRVRSAALAVLLTMLYVVGILVGAAGHVSLRARETLGR